MSKRTNKRLRKKNKSPVIRTNKKIADSLLDVMQDGNEYQSIVDTSLNQNLNILDEVIKGLKELENTRKRRCLAYIGDVVSSRSGESGIDQTDDLPFHEMVDKVPAEIKDVDIFLATRGGLAHQVNRFVKALRTRFEEVDFIIPSFCMSAGTLFALSGDKIWMTERACLGPIDPQVPTKEGRFVPAQALQLLIDKLEENGQDAMKKGGNVPWTAVRIIDGMDKKELAESLTASDYSTNMASEFLTKYKFRKWETRKGSGESVTPEYREKRAKEIAKALASHDKWKNHGHALSRDILWDEIKLKIEHPDHDFHNVIIRLWALCNWIFDKTSVLKMIISENYKYLKFQQQVGRK